MNKLSKLISSSNNVFSSRQDVSQDAINKLIHINLYLSSQDIPQDISQKVLQEISKDESIFAHTVSKSGDIEHHRWIYQDGTIRTTNVHIQDEIENENENEIVHKNEIIINGKIYKV